LRNPRSNVEKLLLGDLSVLDGDNIFYCTTCATCSSRCPQQIDLPHLLIDLKNWVIANNDRIPDHLKAEMDILFKNAATAEMSGMVTKRRAKLGLPEYKMDPNAVDEVQKIMEASGFKNLHDKYCEEESE
jgi:heterodisulfide reductase subunit C